MAKKKEIKVSVVDATAIEKIVILNMWCKTLQSEIKGLNKRIDNIIDAHEKCKSLRKL